MKRYIKNKINIVLKPFNLHLKNKRILNYRYTMVGALNHIKKMGFYPKTIFDVGVATGTWSLYDSFPSSKIILIEPLDEFRPYILDITKKLPGSIYIPAAASNTTGKISINVHPDLTGSSIYKENEDSEVNGTPRIIDGITLDEITEKHQLDGPFLLKIDVQGAELDVLRGAEKVLERSEYIILETVLFQVFINGGQFYDIINYLNKKDFVTYDLFDPCYRPFDGAMSHLDTSFVKKSGIYRKYHSTATRKQREILNKIKRKKFKI